jgi:hypothetical protein
MRSRAPASDRGSTARGAAGGGAAREADRLGRVGGPLGHLRQHLGPASALAVARVARPFVVEARQQLALAQRQRLLGPALGDQLLESEGVHPGVAQADGLAGGHQVPVRGVPQRPAQRRQRGAEARARALLEHVGPKRARDLRARMRARVQRQPGEQGSRLGRCGRLQPLAVGLDAQLSH